MKRLSSSRVEALALSLVDSFAGHPEIDVRDRGAAVRAVAEHLRTAFQIDEGLDRAVRARIESLRRSVPEGSREWDLLYQQYLSELSRRR